jgi:hypothetical protein
MLPNIRGSGTPAGAEDGGLLSQLKHFSRPSSIGLTPGWPRGAGVIGGSNVKAA